MEISIMNHNKLEQILKELKAKGEPPSKEVLDMIKNTDVLSPAFLPKDTPPEIMRRMIQNPGKPQAIPIGVNPQPCILENGNGEKFLAVFTSGQEMKKNKNAPAFPLIMNVSFQDCIDLILRNPEINGAVINPYTQNIVFHIDRNKPQPKTIQLTAEQFHMISRQKFEAYYLPKNLFEKKAEYIERLQKEEGEFLRELYEDVYETEIACPYTPEDFECLSLSISDELALIRINMPSKNLVSGTCPCVLVGWNRRLEKVWYYAVLLIADGKAHLHERKEDGSDVDLGAAPPEGSEMTTVIDLIQGAGNEE